MRVYILIAHPTATSFCHAACDAFASGLREAGHEFEVFDLYGAGFSPLLDEAGLARERGYRGQGEPVPADVAYQQDKVRTADSLALVFPLWWSDVPAILKGWFDRIWTKGFAYSPTGDTELRRLAPRKAFALCASGHPLDKLERDGVASALRASLLGDRLTNVGFRSAELLVLGGLTTADDALRAALLDEAYRRGRDF